MNRRWVSWNTLSRSDGRSRSKSWEPPTSKLSKICEGIIGSQTSMLDRSSNEGSTNWRPSCDRKVHHRVMNLWRCLYLRHRESSKPWKRSYKPWNKVSPSCDTRISCLLVKTSISKIWSLTSKLQALTMRGPWSYEWKHFMRRTSSWRTSCLSSNMHQTRRIL